MASVRSSFLNKENKAEAINAFTRAVEAGVNFKLRENVLNYKGFDELYQMIHEEMPKTGTDMTQLQKHIEDVILPYSTNYSSPFSMAFPDAGNSIAGLSGAILTDFINQNLINWSPCSPMGTCIEMLVITWLRKLVGYPTKDNPKVPHEVGGFTTSGGVASNTIAMLVARERTFPGCMKEGILDTHQPFAVIVPEGIDHYSSRLSIGWLGLGMKHVVKGKTKNFKYDQVALENQIIALTSQNIKVLSITAYAGDSRSMTCDDFVGLRKICDKYNIWLHVDGCHGTQLLFSDKLRQMVTGIELADSITFDPHKVFTLPYAISIVLFKNTKDLEALKQPEDIIMGEEHSFGQITPFYGSRPFLSLRLYMLIKHLGASGLSALIDERCAMARKLADIINDATDFKLVNPHIGINSVMFMFMPPDITPSTENMDMLNSLNSEIQKRLLQGGSIWLHNFQIPDSSNMFGLGEQINLRPLRYMSGNPVIVESHLYEMLEKVRAEGFKIYSSMKLQQKAENLLIPTNVSLGSNGILPSLYSNSTLDSFVVNDVEVRKWIGDSLSSSDQINLDINHNIDQGQEIHSQENRQANISSILSNKLLSNFVALQLILFIKSCADIPVLKFGNLVKPGLGLENTWYSVIRQILDKTNKMFDETNHFQKHLIQSYIQVTAQFFSNTSTIEYLTHKIGVLVPIVVGLDQFVIVNGNKLLYSSFDSFLSADMYFAYGGFLSKTYKTQLGNSFTSQWGHITQNNIVMVHAYAMLFNINQVLEIMLQHPASDIHHMHPEGNLNNYLDLLESHANVVMQSTVGTEHISIRNNGYTNNPNFLGGEAMGLRLSEMIETIRKFCSVEFRSKQERFYVIIYGSYAYRMARASSDLDILFVSENVDQERKRRVSNFIISLHEQFGLRIDNEIPYEKKAVLATDFMQSASEGSGILDNNKNWDFPTIKKDAKYLASDKLLLRFTLGMLVNPHIFIDGDHKLYSAHRNCSTINLIKAVLFVNEIRKTSSMSLTKLFCKGPQGQTGDFYLGFSYREPFISYLWCHLESVLSSVKSAVSYSEHGTVYEFNDEEVLHVEKLGELDT